MIVTLATHLILAAWAVPLEGRTYTAYLMTEVPRRSIARESLRHEPKTIHGRIGICYARCFADPSPERVDDLIRAVRHFWEIIDFERVTLPIALHVILTKTRQGRAVEHILHPQFLTDGAEAEIYVEIIRILVRTEMRAIVDALERMCFQGSRQVANWEKFEFFNDQLNFLASKDADHEEDELDRQAIRSSLAKLPNTRRYRFWRETILKRMTTYKPWTE